MNQDDILYTALIQRAFNNKWKLEGDVPDKYEWVVVENTFMIRNPVLDFNTYRVVPFVKTYSIESVLFNHSFAKKVWGDSNWQYVLVNLVLSENRPLFLKEYESKNTKQIESGTK